VTKFTLTLLLIAIAATAPAAPVAPPPREVKYYYAKSVGAKWVYHLYTKPDANEMTEEITAAVHKGRMTVIKILRSWNNERLTTVHNYMAVSPDGVFFYGFSYNDSRPEAPVCKLDTKARPGDKWELRATWSDGVPRVLLKYEARGHETVEVPAGRFNTMKVETRIPHPAGEADWVTADYYAEGVGLVKTEGRIETGEWKTVLALKTFTPGKDRAP
jgi:hypothetical protein